MVLFPPEEILPLVILMMELLILFLLFLLSPIRSSMEKLSARIENNIKSGESDFSIKNILICLRAAVIILMLLLISHFFLNGVFHLLFGKSIGTYIDDFSNLILQTGDNFDIRLNSELLSIFGISFYLLFVVQFALGNILVEDQKKLEKELQGIKQDVQQIKATQSYMQSQQVEKY